MQGGKRKNAGRKLADDCNKKNGYKIYLTNEQYENIIKYGCGVSFSEKCSNLITSHINQMRSSIKFIDLFAGLGGIRIGFEQGLKKLGFNTECVFTSEIKEHAIKAYKHNFDNKKIFGDITQINSGCIPNFDFLLAGFPCQPFSFAGKGLGFFDTRGTLFFEIERILNDKKPIGFLLENVEGLVTHDNGDTLKTIISHLEALDYKVSWRLLDSKDFGLAQSRKRIYIVGMKNEHINLEDFPVTNAILEDILESGLATSNSNFTKCLFKHYSPEQVVGKSIKDKRGGINNIHSWDIELKGKTTLQQKQLLNILLKERRKKKWAEEIGIKWMDGMPLTIKQIKTFFDVPNLKKILDDLVKKGYLTLEHPREQINGVRIPDKNKPKGYNIVAGKLSFEFSEILDPKELAPTLVAMDISKIGIIDSGGLRKLTVREGLKLCGYPEDYDLSFLKERESFDLLGNTVCVPVIKAIAERIAEKVEITES